METQLKLMWGLIAGSSNVKNNLLNEMQQAEFNLIKNNWAIEVMNEASRLYEVKPKCDKAEYT